MTIHLILPDDLSDKIARRAAAHGYANIDKYVEEILRDYAEQDELYGAPPAVSFNDETRLEALIQVGIDSGAAVEPTDADWELRRQRLLERHQRSPGQ